MTNVADDFSEINRNRKKVRQEEGLGDDDFRTAGGDELDRCAAGYDVFRNESGETDQSVRDRIEAVITKRMWRWKLVF